MESFYALQPDLVCPAGSGENEEVNAYNAAEAPAKVPDEPECSLMSVPATQAPHILPAEPKRVPGPGYESGRSSGHLQEAGRLRPQCGPSILTWRPTGLEQIGTSPPPAAKDVRVWPTRPCGGPRARRTPTPITMTSALKAGIKCWAGCERPA